LRLIPHSYTILPSCPQVQHPPKPDALFQPYQAPTKPQPFSLTSHPEAQKSNPFGLSQKFPEAPAPTPVAAETKPPIENVAQYVTDALSQGNANALTGLGDKDWEKVDQPTLDAITAALQSPEHQDIKDRLAGRIGAVGLRLLKT